MVEGIASGGRDEDWAKRCPVKDAIRVALRVRVADFETGEINWERLSIVQVVIRGRSTSGGVILFLIVVL